MSSTYQKYIDGAYKNTLEYPARPTEPSVLRKRAKDLTSEELASLAEITRAYDDAKAAYEADRRAYGAESGRLNALLQADLEAEYGVTGHPKAELLWSKAYDRGHGSGMGDVINVWTDLVELIQ